ncbi:hypothetical protein B0H13DRAFT_2431038 [Mycena leptocephala]|nr:hypothetical protein B0H13DRAFT_2431038 [Mycena leptocephala]
MHAGFSRTKFLRLPLALRGAANSAFEGSLPHLQMVQRRIRDEPAAYCRLYLPCIYSNLDPSRLALPDDLDCVTPDGRFIAALQAAYCCMEMLDENPTLCPLSSALTDLWPRLWTSMELVRTYCICNLLESKPDLQQFSDGAGGAAEFAALLIRHLDRFSSVAQSDLTVIYFDAAFMFILDSFEDEKHLWSSLLAQGLATSLVKVASTLLQDVVPDSKEVCANCFVILERALKESMPITVEAIKNGLFRAMALFAIEHGSSLGVSPLSTLATYVIPSTLVYRSALEPMKGAVGELDAAGLADKLELTPFRVDWSELRTLITERLLLLEHYRAKDRISTSGCDNLECRVIAEKSRFKRCSACCDSHYCSDACQITDWRLGGHREACSQIPARCFHPFSAYIAGPRDRSFMRALIQHDYERNKHVIVLKQIRHIQKYSATPFYTQFNYSMGRASIDVGDTAKFGEYWSYFYERAAAPTVTRHRSSYGRWSAARNSFVLHAL